MQTGNHVAPLVYPGEAESRFGVTRDSLRPSTAERSAEKSNTAENVNTGRAEACRHLFLMP